MKCNLLFIAACGFLLLTSSLTPALSQPLPDKQKMQTNSIIPDQYLSLYRELDQKLNQAQQTYSFEKGHSCPVMAPNLFIASSFYGSCAAGSRRWNDLLITLDIFKTMHMNAVSVMISAPDLTGQKSDALLDFYRHLTAEIHFRNMKLYVEHFIYPPGPRAQTFQNDVRGKKEFLEMETTEITRIYQDIQPDYLSIVTEPETLNRWTRLTLTPDDWGEWTGRLCAALKKEGNSSKTLLGAGGGIWETPAFVLKFAQHADLDYIDFHFYPLKLGNEDYLDKLAAIIHEIRANRSDMKITIGETWLGKYSAQETNGSADVFFRDNFSFWSPLDQKFFSMMLGFAQKENLSVIAPYFAQFFFSGYDFGSEDAKQLPGFPACVVVAWNKAVECLRRQEVSATGKAVSSMLNDHTDE